MKIWGISFGCERSCSSDRRVSHLLIATYLRGGGGGGIYPHIQFERDPLNTFRLSVDSYWECLGEHSPDFETFGKIVQTSVEFLCS